VYKFKKDIYKNSRGKWSRILDIACHFCKNHICFYQKDGPGPLKRSYVDRFIDIKPKKSNVFKCNSCGETLGIYQPYKKENNRPAYSWLVGALEYDIVPISKLIEVPKIGHQSPLFLKY